MTYTQQFIEILRETLPIEDEAEISPTDDIFDDYGADSLDVRELAIALESVYGIDISEGDEFNPESMTVGSIAEYLKVKGTSVFL